jgi:site-specific DNA-cytosine methylase
MLELFSGTGSVGDVAKELGFEVISLDRDMEATIKSDIMDWDPTVYPKGYFDVIWASPPCTEYSRAKTVGTRDIQGANDIVCQTLDIIEYFEPKYWMIENPQTGLLKDQSCMYGIPFKDIDYCRYGLPYRKRTRIWNNAFDWKPRPLCNKDCNSMNETKTAHKEAAQRGPCKNLQHNRHTRSELYKVPGQLIREILLSLEV